MDEPSLIRRAVEGDASAVDELARLHRDQVVRTAKHLIGDQDLADDIAQEVLLRLASALPGFRGDSELASWLYRITVNLCLDHIRRGKRRPTVELGETVLEIEVDDPGHSVQRQRTRSAVREALTRLPTDQREVLTLRYITGLPYSEIAKVTGTPIGTVASRVFRGLRKLAQDLDPIHLEIVQ